MRAYRAFRLPRQHLPVMVREGFAWRVLFFGWLGLLSFRSWGAGLIAGAVTLCLGLLPDALFAPSLLALHLGMAMFTPDLRSRELRLGGAEDQGVWLGNTRQSAMLRWADARNGATP